MSNVQAAKLIIENIQLLEQAKIILEGEITEKLLVICTGRYDKKSLEKKKIQ